ncbi:TPA: NAD-dependent epimerase/dehydratase family protein [Legionella pneumophila]|nr:NAD-dependent epimerase/dehydratase family protein [Legionella pneumophila subsp. fraseri]HAT1771252.1 NAD-dependent epimerase/dehydratase family protein [Legionella pneumophila]MDX1845280.1 NAD-dependent epimerase/dehydratase family protein [Legionella pneumophila subsp. fraseri]HAT2128256.1 NAD-dependent epimerase/dehydratase family protein [Legionella pneumophila]HAT2135161.1 NAD-dependent epimerase/dehydratase family protein [Legionella pneumophila]
MFSIENKVIVVTGGSGNLGSNLVKYLADQGACVASIDLRMLIVGMAFSCS